LATLLSKTYVFEKRRKLASWQRLLVYQRSPSENCLKIKAKIQQEFLSEASPKEP
jgi:hypothetical protein